MADDKKNIPETAPPAEAPAPTVENAAVPEQPAPEPVLTDAEAVMLEHEGQAALFEMGEAVPDPADAVTHAELEEPAAPEVPKAEKEQPSDPDKDDPTVTFFPIPCVLVFFKIPAVLPKAVMLRHKPLCQLSGMQQVVTAADNARLRQDHALISEQPRFYKLRLSYFRFCMFL